MSTSSPTTTAHTTAATVAATTAMLLSTPASAATTAAPTLPTWLPQDAVGMLREWGFALNIILLAVTILLQYGYASRSMFMYVLKMFVLWLLWPFTLTNSVINCLYPVDQVAFVLSVMMATFTAFIWLMYFINSTRLFLRTGSLWAFNPESNMLLSFPANGKTTVRPILEDSPAIAALVIDRKVTINGMSFGHAALDEMPKQLTVGKPTVLVAYKAAKTVRYSNSAGFVVYTKYKAGNYRTPEPKRNEDLAVLVA